MAKTSIATRNKASREIFSEKDKYDGVYFNEHDGKVEVTIIKSNLTVCADLKYLDAKTKRETRMMIDNFLELVEKGTFSKIG